MNATFKGEVNSSKGQGINTLNQVNTDELLESKAPSSAAMILMPRQARRVQKKLVDNVCHLEQSADVTVTVKRRRHRHRIGNRAATHRSNENPQTIQSATRKPYNQKSSELSGADLTPQVV